MHSVSETATDNANKYFINIDFGTVPVGSVRKRSIDITNDLKASSYFSFFSYYQKLLCSYIIIYYYIFTIYSMVLHKIVLN